MSFHWLSTQVVNSHLVCDPTIWQPGFDLPRQQWSLLNRFRTEQGHCGACRRKWWLTETDLCPCGKTQMMSHIVKSCPPDKTEWRLISATLCGWRHCFVADQLWFMTRVREEWHAYEKKKKTGSSSVDGRAQSWMPGTPVTGRSGTCILDRRHTACC